MTNIPSGKGVIEQINEVSTEYSVLSGKELYDAIIGMMEEEQSRPLQYEWLLTKGQLKNFGVDVSGLEDGRLYMVNFTEDDKV